MATKDIKGARTRVPDPGKLKHGEKIAIISRSSQKRVVTEGVVDGFPWTSDETGHLMVSLVTVVRGSSGRGASKTIDTDLQGTLVYRLHD